MAFGFPVQYRALRSAVAAGAKVFVLGCEQAALLRYSRYCQRFTRLAGIDRDDPRPDPEEVLRQIQARIDQDKIDIVMGTDGKSTRLVTLLSGRFSARTIPIPGVELFDRLDDKQSFHEICKELGLHTPFTRIFETKQDLLQAAREGQLPARSITKPLRSFGERGQFRFDPRRAEEQLTPVDYEPIMVQEVIDGIDHALSLFAHEGKVTGCANHYKDGPQWIFEDQRTFYSYCSKVVSHLKLNGIYNFDCRISAEGKVHMFECNPRTYLSVDYDMMMGFHAFGDAMKNWDGYNGEPTLPVGFVRELLGTAKVALTPWKIQRQDWRFVFFVLRDPIPYGLDFFRLVLIKFPAIAKRLQGFGLVRLLLS